MMFTARSSAGRLAQVSRHFSTARTLAQQQTQDVYIVGAARTATAKFNGSFATTPAPRLGAAAIKAALERSKLPTDKLSHVYMGNVLSAGMGQSPARQAVIFAGLPDTVEATTINKVCASGLKAVALAANDLALGHGDAAVAGGMENMSLVPRYLARATPPFGAVQLEDGLVKDGLWDVYNQIHMGNCAENTACKLGISRAQQDRYAVESYRRAKAAWAQKLFDEEIVPVEVPQRKGAAALVVREDEEYDAVKLDKIPTLKPAFKKDGGTVTAANASTFSDGASALVLASQRLVDALPALKDSRVFARIVAHADAATAPIDFPLAPTLAIPKVLEQAGLTVADIARWEVNEAFAAVSEANAKVLGYDAAKVNVRGGAIALGHALGSSGSRILVSLLHQLEQGEYGVAAICNGGGAATAMVVQKL